MRGIITKKSISVLVAVLLVFGAGSLFIKSSISKTPSKEGYTTIKDVPGVIFDVKKSLNDTSTAVLEVSKNIDFVDYQAYKYKNGEDIYLLFNMKQYIVVAQKGTSFHFSEMSVTESLSKNSLNGIWFELSGKGKNLSNVKNRYTYEVNAQVVITNAMYGDFSGILSTLEKEGEEWSLFVGITGKQSDELLSMVTIVTESFALSEIEKDEPGNYEISIDNGIFTSIEEKSETENSNYAEEDDFANNDEIEKVPIIEKTPNEKGEKEIFEVESNQKEFQKSEENAYTSSIYSMLSMGDTGYMDLRSEINSSLLGAYIRITNVYDAVQTRLLIEEYINSGDAYYTQIEAPDGCHFEAVEYEVKFATDEKSYVNISLKGFDGEELRHRGVAYSHMTYDILNKEETQSDWYKKRICFYAIPNGCREYVLKCGDNRFSAYYHIKTEG